MTTQITQCHTLNLKPTHLVKIYLWGPKGGNYLFVGWDIDMVLTGFYNLPIKDEKDVIFPLRHTKDCVPTPLPTILPHPGHASA